jgi:hypothetical protein
MDAGVSGRQASPLKCSSASRIHHLLKTFGDWRDRQLRDGTVIWTSPSGDTYVTTPGSALLFPSQNKAQRVAAERRLNRQNRETELGRRRWEQALAMATTKDEPPPF